MLSVTACTGTAYPHLFVSKKRLVKLLSFDTGGRTAYIGIETSIADRLSVVLLQEGRLATSQVHPTESTAVTEASPRELV